MHILTFLVWVAIVNSRSADFSSKTFEVTSLYLYHTRLPYWLLIFSSCTSYLPFLYGLSIGDVSPTFQHNNTQSPPPHTPPPPPHTHTHTPPTHPRYDVELYQRIEQLIGKKLPLHATVEEEVMSLMERVSEAQRHAKMVREGGI